MRRHQVLDRLFYSSLTLAIVGTSFFERESMIYGLVQEGGAWAFLSMAALGGFGLVAMVDTIVNDVLPPKWMLHTALRFRQTIWLLIAVTFSGHAFVIMRADKVAYWVMVVYMLYSCRCAAVAFADLAYEFDESLPRETDHGVLDA